MLGLFVGAWLTAACQSGPEEKQGSLEDLDKLMADAKPVQGTSVDGAQPLEADPFALADPMTTPKPHTQEANVLGPRQDPYIRFGERIIVRAGVGGETFITKPYTMPTSKAERLVALMAA